MRWLPALGLLGCAEGPAFADLNLVVVSSGTVEAAEATMALERVVLAPCDGEPAAIEVGYRLNLRSPEPIPVPVDTYCDVALELAPDPFDGALRLRGQTARMSFQARLDPGLVVHEQAVGFGLDSEGLLALDLARLFAFEQVDAIEAREAPVVIEPDEPLARDLSDQVGPALVFLSSPEEGASLYLDLWPDLDLSVDARVDASGCRGPGTVTYEPPTVDPPDPIATPVEEPDDEEPPSASGSEAGCASCRGGGEDRGCGRGAGCAGACSTTGFAPIGVVGLLALLPLRRRRMRA